MKIPQQITDLLHKPMDRRDFLKHLAVGTLMIIGGGMIVKSFGLAEKIGLDSTQSNIQAGYGASVYGGVQRLS